MPNRVVLRALKAGLRKISVLKAEISSKRNALREAVEDLESVVESMDETETSLEDGLRSLNDAIDSMSKYL